MSKPATVAEYLGQLPEDRRDTIEKLRKTIKENLPEGFEETLGYGMIGYVVPHSKYPPGYHCDPQLPLPFLSLAAQKSHFALYHMGIYARPELLKWFTEEHAKASAKKLDMGKSCIRYKKPEDIPYKLIGELCRKMSPDEWINTYESLYKRK